MEIPNTVSILGVPYEVAVGEMEDGEDGSISPRRQLITLREGMCEEKRAQVYLHELIHGILDQLGYAELYGDEHLVQGLAIGLHQALGSG